jgi:hypothetical protein
MMRELLNQVLITIFVLNLAILFIKYVFFGRFPPDKFPVLSFTSPPGNTPLAAELRRLQKYMRWSMAIRRSQMKNFN